MANEGMRDLMAIHLTLDWNKEKGKTVIIIQVRFYDKAFGGSDPVLSV